MVAAQPVKVVPVAHLVFHLRLARLALAHPHATAVPIHLSGDNVADGAVLDALDRVAIYRLVAALQTHHHIEALPLGLFGRRQHLAHARDIDRYGFLHENVLALPNSLLKMRGSETRRRTK